MADESAARPGDIAAVERGLIIQRVLVDGWSPYQAATAHGIDERLVVRWLAAYRRRGMASLRGEAGERGLWRWACRLGLRMARLVPGWGPAFGRAAAPCIVLRHSGHRHGFRA